MHCLQENRKNLCKQFRHAKEYVQAVPMHPSSIATYNIINETLETVVII